MLKTVFYDDEPLRIRERSIFLAGPTGRDVIRTPWRQEALDLLSKFRPEATVVLPEFRDRKFDPSHFPALPWYGRVKLFPTEPIPHLKPVTQNILDWETACIDRCHVLIVWMPFSDELPGRTTRNEVSRAIEQTRGCSLCWKLKPSGIVLGIPPGTESSGHIRYHAHRAGIQVFDTLRQCCLEAARLTHFMEIETPEE